MHLLESRENEFVTSKTDNAFANWTRLAVLVLVTVFITSWAKAEDASFDKIDINTAFLPVIELTPFEVKGEELSISVYARSNSDRRYAKSFAESVVEVAYDTIEKSTGHGLVIIGDEGEPHPVFVFRKFLQMADENRLNPDLSESAKDLRNMLKEWEDKIQLDVDSDDMGGVNIDFDILLKALPLPLEGLGSKLYLMAWTEEFGEQRIERRLESLTMADLETDEFSKYDWVFYLPERSAFKRVLKELLPLLMKEAELGFFKRVALRGAIAAFKPLIKDAIEGVRKGMLFLTVLRAKSDFSEGDTEALVEAYMEALMPHGKLIPGKKRQRAMEAIKAKKIENAEYAKDPFVSPTPLEQPDFAAYSKFEGEYSYGKKVTHRFSVKDQVCYWQYLDWDPGVFLPAGDNLFVSEDGKMTIEFLSNEEGSVSSVEERWVRRRNTIPQKI